ncbi:endonuclease/exonuclease/phosphatase family protein [Thermoflavimicrobium daqui]|uniref:Endonuclease/exonuclease/phosphatase domain-containing protein n=1 Tax=Thermoflavimicrobium daqui TaxID=2137476 RepID=A0A364K121_9BACL|nr:endonuclease/exonuclease/phosphatase family protein [Thermoflavimicrobium daqui]RAL21390.1 hypothetical protein DL897_16760 [Thermoflavimicrobium daqui]
MKRRMAKWLFTLLVSFTMVFSSSTAFASSANETVDFKAMAYNVYMLSSSLTGGWKPSFRADLISKADFMKGHDIVILNELFDNNASNKLLSSLSTEYANQTPVLGRSRSGWNQTLGRYSDWVPEDGGVAIISKWPILEKVQYVFANGCGADYYANKGFVYVKKQS